MKLKPETINWYGGPVVIIPVVWSCPHCGTMNVDYRELTACPMCENCLNAYDWSELPEVSE